MTNAGACGAALLLVLSSQTAPAQQADSTRSSRTIGGAVTVTNNGISLLPTFSLGKPAVIFDMSVGSPRVSFEPQFRFALEGKPWSFIFWWRYKLLRRGRFSVNAGAHPAVLFQTIASSTDTSATETIVAQRYLAAELSPRYALTADISLGAYYLYSHGFEETATKNTNFLAVNASFANLGLTERLRLRIAPQLYYLRMDDRDGYYATATVSLFSPGFPVSVQSIINRSIHTTIVSDAFVWNVSLVYSFSREYQSTVR